MILARDGNLVAKSIRYQAPKMKPPGCWKGKVKVSPDWNSCETNAEIAALFEKSVMRIWNSSFCAKQFRSERKRQGKWA